MADGDVFRYTVRQSGDLPLPVGDLISLLITALGVVAGYLTVKNWFEKSRSSQRNRRRENLIPIIENGIEELDETYSDLYAYQFKLQSSELNRISRGTIACGSTPRCS